MGVTLVFVTPMNNMMSNRTQAHLRTYRYANKIRIRSRQLQKFFTLPIYNLETEEYYSSKFTQSASRMGLRLKKQWKLLACTMAFLMFMTMSPSLIPIRRRMGGKNLKDAIGCWIEITTPTNLQIKKGIEAGHGFLVTKLMNPVDQSDCWKGYIQLDTKREFDGKVYNWTQKSVLVKKIEDGKNWKWTEVPIEERERCEAVMRGYDMMEARDKKKALKKLQNTQSIAIRNQIKLFAATFQNVDQSRQSYRAELTKIQQYLNTVVRYATQSGLELP